MQNEKKKMPQNIATFQQERHTLTHIYEYEEKKNEKKPGDISKGKIELPMNKNEEKLKQVKDI